MLDALLALSGAWQGRYQLRGDPSFDGDSDSTAQVTPVLGARFVRVDYTWSDRGTAQEGLLLIGGEPKTGVVTVVWLDSWHNGPRMMTCTGAGTPDGGIDVRGTYPAGPGSPDWGWRTRIDPHPDAWTLTMFNVTPEGEEALAVQVEYRR